MKYRQNYVIDCISRCNIELQAGRFSFLTHLGSLKNTEKVLLAKAFSIFLVSICTENYLYSVIPMALGTWVFVAAFWTFPESQQLGKMLLSEAHSSIITEKLFGFSVEHSAWNSPSLEVEKLHWKYHPVSDPHFESEETLLKPVETVYLWEKKAHPENIN